MLLNVKGMLETEEEEVALFLQVIRSEDLIQTLLFTYQGILLKLLSAIKLGCFLVSIISWRKWWTILIFEMEILPVFAQLHQNLSRIAEEDAKNPQKAIWTSYVSNNVSFVIKFFSIQKLYSKQLFKVFVISTIFGI